MKRIIIIITLILTIILCTNIYASEVNIENITVYDKSDTIEVSNVTIIDSNILSNITFHNVNDYVVFELNVSKSDESYIINNITDNNTSDTIDITYDYSQQDKPIKMTIKYVKEVFEPIELNDVNINIEVIKKSNVIEETNTTNEDIVNPKTLDVRSIVLIVLLLILIVSIVLFIKYKNKTIININIIFIVLLLPIIIYADNGISVNLVLKMNGVKIVPNTAVFKTGSELNIHMKTLASLDNANTETVDTHIISFERNSTITDELKKESNIVSTKESIFPIYLWYEKIDDSTGKIYYYTEANNVFLNENADAMFNNFTKLETINEREFNYSNTKSMANFFRKCSSLKKVDLSNMDLSEVEGFSGIFAYCTNIEEINLDNIKFTKLKNIGNLFFNCNNLTKVSLKNIDTSKVTSMIRLFYGCKKLEEVDLSTFSTKSNEIYDYMFYDCNKLKRLDLKSFDTVNMKTAHSMFHNCSSLTNVDLSSFNLENATDLSYMFSNNSSLQTIDLSSFDTTNINNIGFLFNGCTNLKTIYVKNNLNLDNITSDERVFYGCNSLEGGNGTTINSNPIDKTYARLDITGAPGYFTYKYSDKDSHSFGYDDMNVVLSCLYRDDRCGYKIGDTRELDLGSLGKHNIRIANYSSPESCNNESFSQTSCGVVLEFTDAIVKGKWNETDTNVGGFKDSYIRGYINNDIYNGLPTTLKNAVIETKVISNHGTTQGEDNFVTNDKLYLLSIKEVFGEDIPSDSNSFSYDTSNDFVRQLDYYKNNNVQMGCDPNLLYKKYEDVNVSWWLRSVWKNNKYSVVAHKNPHPYYVFPTSEYGVSPAFRVK